MTLEPILIDVDKSKHIYANPYCQYLFESYPAYYFKVGYNPPWIGYFVLRDGIVVGVAGFVEKPVNGRVEIAYGTRKDCEGQGIASFSCRQLISIAKSTEPKLTITAKTSPEENASTRILKRNGFEYGGIVQDHEIGDAWEWIYKESGV